jgi:hypothetical protein
VANTWITDCADTEKKSADTAKKFDKLRKTEKNNFAERITEKKRRKKTSYLILTFFIIKIMLYSILNVFNFFCCLSSEKKIL